MHVSESAVCMYMYTVSQQMLEAHNFQFSLIEGSLTTYFTGKNNNFEDKEQSANL